MTASEKKARELGHFWEWSPGQVEMVARALEQARADAFEEAAKSIESYMHTDKYGSAFVGRYYLVNAASLVRALKREGER